jgi:hypothetical protein
MKTLTLYVPVSCDMHELSKFVRMFRDAGYRFADLFVRDDVAGIIFEKQEKRNDEQTTPA